MRLLLDTCIVYDWLMGKVSNPETITLIQTNGAYVSPISVWEIIIKYRLGKLELPTTDIAADIGAQGFTWLNITAPHTQTVIHLEDHHKDPFDRLLIAQARHEGMQIVTYDTVFQNYLADTLIIKKTRESLSN